MPARLRVCVFAALMALLTSAPLAALAAQAVPTAVGPEIRAVWAHPGQFGPDPAQARAKMREAMDEWSRAGIDTVIMLVKTTSGLVYWPSKIADRDPAYAGYDLLGLLIEEAGRKTIAVQPWFCVFNEGAIPGPFRKHPEWLIRSPEGEMVGVANPALPEVRDYERSLMLEVAAAYPVDWIHLDYIRYPSSPREVYFSWDAKTRALFKEYSGLDPVDMKARDSGNILWDEWIVWNRGRVTAFLKELRSGLAALGRPVKVSAAVFPVGRGGQSPDRPGLGRLVPGGADRHALPHALHQQPGLLREVRPPGHGRRRGPSARPAGHRGHHVAQPGDAGDSDGRGGDRAPLGCGRARLLLRHGPQARVSGRLAGGQGQADQVTTFLSLPFSIRSWPW